MTQELVASMLGVRREGITEAAGRSAATRAIIRYRRGHIAVLDRSGLERCACECYSAVKIEFDRLLSAIPQHEGLRPVGRSGPQIDSRRASMGQ